MTTSELIAKLQELLAKHGDLPVQLNCFTTPCEVSSVVKIQANTELPYILID